MYRQVPERMWTSSVYLSRWKSQSMQLSRSSQSSSRSAIAAGAVSPAACERSSTTSPAKYDACRAQRGSDSSRSAMRRDANSLIVSSTVERAAR